MTIRQELQEIPGALRQMFDEGRPLYDSLIRRVNWGEKPVFMVGDGSSWPAALSGAWAFESLLGMPAIVQRPQVFSAYTCRAVVPRSLVIVIAGPDGQEETLAAAKQARRRGAIVWAITANPAGDLAALADATANDYSEDSAGNGSRAVFCRHAVMLFLALAAARILKPPGQAPVAQEEELGRLARHVEWVLNQISDAGSALAGEVSHLSNLYVTGGGAFYPIALQAARRLRQRTGRPAGGFELLDFQQSFCQISQPGSGILYLSSSRCGLKAQVHRSAREARQEGKLKIFAVTDSNDRQLSERADLAVLLPILTEAGAALLALAFVELAASHAAQASSAASARQRHAVGPSNQRV